MGALLVGAAVGLTGLSIYSSEKARSQQKKATKAQNKIRQVQESRERLSAIREQRIRQAQIIQSGATGGALDSSGVQGAYSATGSATAGNLQFINTISQLQQNVASHMNRANDWAATASVAGQAANLAVTASSFSSPKTGAGPGPSDTGKL